MKTVTKRATVEISGDPVVTYDRMRVVHQDGTALMFDPSGQLIEQGVVVGEAAADRRTTVLTMESGDTWTVTPKRGCGCGGG